MSVLRVALPLLVSLATLAASAQDHGGSHAAKSMAGSATPASRAAALAAADWSNRIDINLEMHDYGYRPREFRLRVGQPYRLLIANTGSVSHYFNAPEFFAAVASRKAEVPRVAEVKAEVFSSFEVHGRGGTLEYYFVPLVPGTYRAHCHIKDHLELNIEAFITIE